MLLNSFAISACFLSAGITGIYGTAVHLPEFQDFMDLQRMCEWREGGREGRRDNAKTHVCIWMQSNVIHACPLHGIALYLLTLDLVCWSSLAMAAGLIIPATAQSH